MLLNFLMFYDQGRPSRYWTSYIYMLAGKLERSYSKELDVRLIGCLGAHMRAWRASKRGCNIKIKEKLYIRCLQIPLGCG